jgi:SAM-dependent methyltransferase
MDLIESVHGRYVHKRRTSVLSCWCSRLIPSNSRVLDVGCGDGQLARLIADKRSDISICGIDVRQRKDSAMLVETFDGKSIPYGKDSFDVVMLVDVIHHADQPITLLRDAARVAKQAILIKDHLVEGTFAYLTLQLMDWIGNARHGVSLPYNYWTLAKWHGVFDELRLNITFWESNLRLYPFPADLILGRSLHFIALLGTPGESEVHIQRDKVQAERAS